MVKEVFQASSLFHTMRQAGAPDLEQRMRNGWGDQKVVHMEVPDWHYANEFLPRDEQDWWEIFREVNSAVAYDTFCVEVTN